MNKVEWQSGAYRKDKTHFNKEADSLNEEESENYGGKVRKLGSYQNTWRERSIKREGGGGELGHRSRGQQKVLSKDILAVLPCRDNTDVRESGSQKVACNQMTLHQHRGDGWEEGLPEEQMHQWMYSSEAAYKLIKHETEENWQKILAVQFSHYAPTGNSIKKPSFLIISQLGSCCHNIPWHDQASTQQVLGKCNGQRWPQKAVRLNQTKTAEIWPKASLFLPFVHQKMLSYQ